MKSAIKKYIVTTIVFIAATLAIEVAILITTKAVGWDHANKGRPWAVAAHVHLIALGAIWSIILALMEKSFCMSRSKLSKPAYIVYLCGLSAVVLLILYKGFSQLAGVATITAITDGGAALAHTTLFIGLLLWGIVFLKSVNDSHADKDDKTT